jgi:hypothetical protein
MRRWVASLPAKVADSLVVPALVVVVLVVAAFVLDVLDDDITVWVAVVGGLLFGAAGLAVGRRTGPTQELVGQLLLEIDLNQYYADHLYEVLETLQKVITERIPGVSFSSSSSAACWSLPASTSHRRRARTFGCHFSFLTTDIKTSSWNLRPDTG